MTDAAVHASSAPPDGGAPDELSLKEWIAKNIQLLIAVGSVGLLILRVVRVAHGSSAVEQRLITAGSALSVIFGALAPVTPYLLFAATVATGIGGVSNCRASRRAARQEAMIFFTLMAVGILLIAYTVPWPMIPYLALWLLVISAAAWLGDLVVVEHRINPWRYWRERRSSGVRLLKGTAVMWVCAALVFILLQVGLDDRPWIPSEHISSGTTNLVGYVLSDDSGKLTFMTDTTRELVLVDGNRATETFCHVTRHGRWARLQGSLQRFPTLVQVLGWEAQPSPGATCPLLK